MQLRADLFNYSVESMNNIEVSVLGAAILGAVAVGEYADYPTAVERMVSTARVYHPNPQVHEMYEEKYQRYLEIRG